MFSFKQFSIRHDRCAMKVGTDGVLLGAWACTDGKKQILDVGTGTGLIALMTAQRNPSARITGIDIDASALEQAKENVENSPWADRICIMRCNFNCPDELTDCRFDVIVSNPPFYKAQVHADDRRRDMARRADALPITSLMEHAARLLAPDGLLSLILPAESCADAIGEAALRGLYLARRCDVQTKPGKPPKRTLIEFSKRMRTAQVANICLNDAQNLPSNEYRRLTEAFYLHF